MGRERRRPSRSRDRVGGATAAMRAALIMSVMPLAAAGLVLATPDAPLLAATAVAIYCLVRALESPVGSSGSLRWWIATGAALGVAFSSKYTSILLPVAVVDRRCVRARVARATCAKPGRTSRVSSRRSCSSPVLVWNASHGWISFVFQLRHGLSAPQGSALLAAWKHEGDFFGGQAALASPILFIMMAIAVGVALASRCDSGAIHARDVWRSSRSHSSSTARCVSASSRTGRRRRTSPRSYCSRRVVERARIDVAQGRRRARGADVGRSSTRRRLRLSFPIKPSKDPIARAFGWRELARRGADAAAAAAERAGSTTWIRRRSLSGGGGARVS